MSVVVSQRLDSVFFSLCKGINTPKSLAAWLLYSHREFDQLLKLAPRASDYLDHRTFRDDYLVCEYLSKNKALPTGIDTAKVAFDSFIESEAQCARTNQRIRNMFDERSETPLFVCRVISSAQTIIESVLGSTVPYADIVLQSRWGSGATATLRGASVSYQNKLREKRISCTPDALPLVRAAAATDYGWLRSRGIDADGPISMLDSEFVIIQGSRGLFVDKNAKTDRFISAEPSGNLFLQLGFGSAIRKRLKRVGVNLDDQKINQRYAARAWVDGLATVDLSRASDTICRELVWLLLPPSWAFALDSVRSPACQLEGRTYHLSKFSSMGNGFTFELESLIFWALARATQIIRGDAQGPISVYGDDIICPVGLVPMLRDIFTFCGFTLNDKKTHSDGPFRESCGKHYFEGYDVSPIYQKTDLTGIEQIRGHNRLLYHAIDRGFTHLGVCYADRTLRPAVKHCRDTKSRHRTPLIGDPESRSLDGGYVTGISAGCAVKPGHRRLQKVLSFEPFVEEQDDCVGYALIHRSRDSEKFCFWSSHYSLGYRLQKLRTFTEPLPYQGTENKRDAGRWRITRRYLPEACSLRWV